MSTFAFGICVMDRVDHLTNFAEDIKLYVLQAGSEFYIELGGNAYAYWLYQKQQYKGLAFDVTNSVTENTAERIFQLTAKDMDAPNIERSVSERLCRVQDLIRYMFENSEVREVLFYIVDDYCGPECLESIELCHSDGIVSKLSDYCLQRMGANLALKILR